MGIEPRTLREEGGVTSPEGGAPNLDWAIRGSRCNGLAPSAVTAHSTTGGHTPNAALAHGVILKGRM